MSNYDDMIHLSRPGSSHPKMLRQDRAKLFAPFAALSGHGAAIQAQDRVLVPQIMMTDYAKECLDRKLRMLRKGDVVTITFFLPVQRNLEETLGEYRTVADSVVRVDTMERVLYLTSQVVPFDNLTDLGTECLDELEAARDDMQ